MPRAVAIGGPARVKAFDLLPALIQLVAHQESAGGDATGLAARSCCTVSKSAAMGNGFWITVASTGRASFSIKASACRIRAKRSDARFESRRGALLGALGVIERV